MAEINERQDKPEGEIPADEIRRRKAVMFANRSLKNKRYRFSKRSRDTGFVTAAAAPGIRHEEKALADEPQQRIKAPRKEREKHTDNSSVRDEKLRRRAAYIKEMISQENIIADHTGEYDSSAASSNENLTKNEIEYRKDETDNSAEHGSHHNEVRRRNDEHRVISPDVAERMKKAAYIKSQLERKLTEDRQISSYSDDNSPDIPTSEKHGISDDMTVTDKEASKPYEGRFIGNSERYEIEASSEYRRKTAIKQAYEKAMIRRRNNIQAELRRRDAEAQTAAATTAERYIISSGNERNGVNALLAESKAPEFYNNSGLAGTVLAEKSKFHKYENIADGLVSAGDNISEYADAVQSGDAARLTVQPAAKILRDNSGSTGKAALDVSNAVTSAERSDSIGSAILDISAVLAVNEAKKRFMNILKGKAPEEQKQRVEHRKSKKYHYVDGDENGGRFADRIEQLKKNSFKEKLAKERLEQSRQRERDFIRQKQSAIFLRHNKDNTAFLPNREKLKGFIAKKGKFLLFAGGGLAAVVPILAIIIVIAVIASFFGWLLPMDYSLAGEDDKISAETTAEVIDGYCKLIKNYMDVTQAYYYLTYGDWYGGTYNYPAAAGEYSSFFSNYCKKKADEIRSIYEPYIDVAHDPAERNHRINEMNKAISDAMKNADKEAKAEFEKMLSEVDDTFTSSESRQPYEFSRNDGANGISDSTEFTDKPIVGTNFFGNTEIQSDLSAEELLSYIALYKTLKTFDTAKSEDEDSEDESMVNISPKDISEFFKETEYIPISVEITHDNSCDGKCKRRMKTGSEGGIEWEYYCDGDHDNLYGEIGNCISEDELLTKIIELTEPEKYGMDEESCKKMIGEYLELIKKELDISEDDFRQFGAADSEKAKEFYDMLTDEDKGEIPNNFWDVYLPMDGESEGDDE